MSKQKWRRANKMYRVRIEYTNPNRTSYSKGPTYYVVSASKRSALKQAVGWESTNAMWRKRRGFNEYIPTARWGKHRKKPKKKNVFGW